MSNVLFRISVCLTLSATFYACCHYPKSNIVPTVSTQKPSTITLVAYGDTRTGPWGLGDNAGQAIHGKVVDDIFLHDGTIDGVVFTGDAVMSNFAVWKKAYWKCFLSQANRFISAGIKFYPSLGNHEVLPSSVPALEVKSMAATGFSIPSGPANAGKDDLVAQAYDFGEEPRVELERLSASKTTELVDLNSALGRSEIKNWASGASSGDPEKANKLGQLERHIQTTYYKGPADSRCSSDAKIFQDDYLNVAKYAYLGPLLMGRSYYSVVLEKNTTRVKLIALDTNCLDSNSQQQFFVDELKNFDGPVIVFGHHPPVDYDHPSPWPWDMIPGWVWLRSYLSNADGKKVVLWLFGHVHDYQRRDSSGGTANKSDSPVILVSGGGGAPPDLSAPSFQWQPSQWPPEFKQISAYHQVRIVIMDHKVEVDIRGNDHFALPFKRIDSFSVQME